MTGVKPGPGAQKADLLFSEDLFKTYGLVAAQNSENLPFILWGLRVADYRPFDTPKKINALVCLLPSLMCGLSRRF